MSQVQNNGIIGAVDADVPVIMLMVSFSAIALYNVLELSVIIFTTFKRRKGLYFWSFIVATWGIVPHTVGFVLKFVGLTSAWWAPLILISVGWFGMVTGQSLVLYSRLHLVTRDSMRIRWVLYMIIINAIIFGIPIMILAFLTNQPSPDPAVVNAFSIFDKIQVGLFFVQESIISLLYIYETVRLLGPSRKMSRNPLLKLLTHLTIVNVLALILDATLLGTEYSGNYEIQTTYKPAIYSIKLKIEFSVLNRLVSIVKNKEFAAFSNRSRNTNSLALNTFAQTVVAAAHRGSIDADKENVHPRVTTTEFGLGQANRNEQARTDRKDGIIMDVERQISTLESQIQLADEYQHK
jgi:hypothetical protein